MGEGREKEGGAKMGRRLNGMVVRLSDVEEMKEEWIRSIGDKGQKMAIVAKAVEEWCQAPDISKTYQEVLKEITFGEVIELAEKEKWSKKELLDWLDQKAWDKGNEDLSVDMADLLLEPLDEDEEWVKLKEEVWGAEAPNGSTISSPTFLLQILNMDICIRTQRILL
ncbi:hypothetical protein RhiJN_11908 [Ceratobasidium sp. AG-Ba]|nr:hypothetical protein RhiJN_11908 [Ceratobasidium sp. AG-Ba]